MAEQHPEDQRRDDALPVYRLALEDGRNAFNDLMAQPEKIRRNVGALLGFAAIGVSIFGFAAGRPADRFGWICQIGALVGLLGLVICATLVTLPRKLIPSMDATDIVAWGDAGDSESMAVRNLALHLEENYQQNREIIRRLFWCQIVATISFGLAVIMLAIRVIGD